MRPKIRKGLNNLFRIDAIRISKLFEMFQYTILAFILGFISGSLINKRLPKVEKDEPTPNLIADLFVQIFLVSVCLYYSQKILRLVKDTIPFFFSLSKKYVPCKHNECIVGVTLGFSLSFMGSLSSFHDRVELLHERFFA